MIIPLFETAEDLFGILNLPWIFLTTDGQRSWLQPPSWDSFHSTPLHTSHSERKMSKAANKYQLQCVPIQIKWKVSAPQYEECTAKKSS